MADFIALKKLSESDLTFFEKLYRAKRKSGQKSINLNADVFIDQFYGSLETIASATAGEVRVGLTVFGPGGAGAYRLTRKITKGRQQLRPDGNPQRAYKNWRLNGEFIYDPDGEVGRFDQLVEHDLAVIAFDGVVAPTNVTLILIAQSSTSDSALHTALSPLVTPPRATMMALSVEEIDRALELAGTSLDHPLQIFSGGLVLKAAFEDAALGGATGQDILRKRRVARPITADELDRAKRAAERTGALGEGLIDAYFSGADDVESHIWEAEINAIAPYDFTVVSKNESFRVDAKSTRGRFESDFHVSFGEFVAARESDIPYFIYRVYELTDDAAWFRASCDIRKFAIDTLTSHDQAMQKGVRADTFSVSVDNLIWGDPVQLTFQGDDSDADD